VAAALFHGFEMMNPMFPEAQPWANLVMALAAIAVVVRNPATMLRGEGAATPVATPSREGAAVRPVAGSTTARRVAPPHHR